MAAKILHQRRSYDTSRSSGNLDQGKFFSLERIFRGPNVGKPLVSDYSEWSLIAFEMKQVRQSRSERECQDNTENDNELRTSGAN